MLFYLKIGNAILLKKLIYNTQIIIMSNNPTMKIETGEFVLPFKVAVLNDEAYENIKQKLENGEKYVKSYYTTCPHINKEDCKCPFNLNFLQDKKVYRTENGKMIPVMPFTEAIQVSNMFKHLKEKCPEDYPNVLRNICEK